MNDSYRHINQDIKSILSKNEPAFEGTILEGRKRRYTVINEADRLKYLTQEENAHLNDVLGQYFSKIEEGRTQDGKPPYNSYVIINVDESYIDDIVSLMKKNGQWD